MIYETNIDEAKGHDGVRLHSDVKDKGDNNF
jgi:hypothetical protein